MQRVRHANRGRLLLRTPGPVPLLDLHVFSCRDQSLLNLSGLRTFKFRISLGTSLFLKADSVFPYIYTCISAPPFHINKYIKKSLKFLKHLNLYYMHSPIRIKLFTAYKSTEIALQHTKTTKSKKTSKTRRKQNRSTEGYSKLKRSVDMTSSGKNSLNIRTNASPKWDRTRCPEE